MKRIGVLTSGGDAPGMNACIKAVVEACATAGAEAYGFYRGYQGIIDNDYKLLTKKEVKFTFNFGGSFLQSARSKDFLMLEKRKLAIKNLNKLKIDALICIGGNGTFLGALELQALGVNVIAIPATVDNDVFSTERSIGFDTAVYNAVNMIDNIKQTMSSNGRIGVVEVMGRHGGDIALYAAFASDSNMVIIPEEKRTREEIITELKRLLTEGVDSPIVIVAENQFDIAQLAKEIEESLGKECRSIVLGYMQRGGMPTPNDRILATRYGVQAVHLLLNGSGNCALCLKNDLLSTMEIADAIKEKSHFRSDIYGLFNILNGNK